MFHKFSIITPCYNAEKYINETIKSVFDQISSNNDFEIEYIIIDGVSADKTINKIEALMACSPMNCKCKLIVEKDQGMYDALAKGLSLVTGDICAYINADDFYSRKSFSVVNEIFNNNGVKWITGINTVYNDRSEITFAKMPYIYRSDFIKKGVYGKVFPFIQQESTFWHVDLNNQIDFGELSKIKYAGDFYLWKNFSEIAELNIVEAILAGFRISKGQLSENMKGYMDEFNTLVDKDITILDYAILLLDKIKDKYPIRFNKNIIRYRHQEGKWC